MQHSPLVTVLMSVYNDLRFLPESTSSILAQTLGDFEFLIIDDGSDDQTSHYLQSLTDPRVRILRNEVNRGITHSLNRGLDAARGQFIARMDADDIAEPERLARQIVFLNSHPYTGIVGTGRTLIDEWDQVVGHAIPPQTPEAIRFKCLLGSPFAHPTVVYRRDLIETHEFRYDEAFPAAEDYELWTRILQVSDGANLPEPLLRYRLRNGISRSRREEQLGSHDQIALMANRRLLPSFPLSAEQVKNLRGRFGGQSVREPSMNPDDSEWLNLLFQMRQAFETSYKPVDQGDSRPIISRHRY